MNLKRNMIQALYQEMAENDQSFFHTICAAEEVLKQSLSGENLQEALELVANAEFEGFEKGIRAISLLLGGASA